VPSRWEWVTQPDFRSSTSIDIRLADEGAPRPCTWSFLRIANSPSRSWWLTGLTETQARCGLPAALAHRRGSAGQPTARHGLKIVRSRERRSPDLG